MADRELTRVISNNDLHVIMTQFLTTAKDLHTAMCLFDDDHAAQKYLNSAMHSALIGAEQCRQLHKTEKQRIVVKEVFDAEAYDQA